MDDLALRCVSSSFVTSQLCRTAGLAVAQTMQSSTNNALVFATRSKRETQHLIAQAVEAAPSGWIVIDGQKTDGIESLLKLVRREVETVDSYAKAHGKVFWFPAQQAQNLKSWRATPAQLDSDFITAPGVFSADGIDPASELLCGVLPTNLSGTGVDLGAGWGYLSARVLNASSDVRALHLVEDNVTALNCAEQNVTDARAAFHWADALYWQADRAVDFVIMNPPFHTGRSATPELGLGFIRSSARILRPGGQLYMVANAHLPYEEALAREFASVELLTRTSRFKVFQCEKGRGKAR